MEKEEASFEAVEYTAAVVAPVMSKKVRMAAAMIPPMTPAARPTARRGKHPSSRLSHRLVSFQQRMTSQEELSILVVLSMQSR